MKYLITIFKHLIAIVALLLSIITTNAQTKNEKSLINLLNKETITSLEKQ